MNRKLTLLLPILLLLGACSQSKIIQTKVGQTEVYEGFEYKAHFTDYLKPEQIKIYQEQYDYIKNNPDKVQPEYSYYSPIIGNDIINFQLINLTRTYGEYDKYIEYFYYQFEKKHPDEKVLFKELTKLNWLYMSYRGMIKLNNISNVEIVSKARATKLGIYFFVKTLQDPESQKFLHIHPDIAKKLIKVLSNISFDNFVNVIYQGLYINRFSGDQPYDWNSPEFNKFNENSTITTIPFDLFTIDTFAIDLKDIKSDYEINFFWLHGIQPEHVVFKELFTERYLKMAEKEFDPSKIVLGSSSANYEY